MPNSGSKRKGHLKFFLEWLFSNIEDWISIIDIQGQDSADEALHPAAEEPLDPFQDLMHSLDSPRNKGTEISSVQGLVVDTVPSAEVGPEETWARIAKAMEDLGIPADVVMGQQSNTMHWIKKSIDEQKGLKANAKISKPKRASRKIKKVTEESEVAKASSSKVLRTPSPNADAKNDSSDEKSSKATKEAVAVGRENKVSEDNKENGIEEQEEAQPAYSDDGTPQYVDHGRFVFNDVMVGIGSGTLDEKRVRRLLRGFQLLIKNCLGRETESYMGEGGRNWNKSTRGEEAL